MLKRVISAAAVFAFLTACTKGSDLEMVYNPVKGFSTGFWQVAVLVDAETNFSSLLYDKTEAAFTTFNFHTFQQLPAESTYFIVPTAHIDHNGKKSYDKSYTRLLASYLKMNRFGKVTEALDEADYIIMVDVEESNRSLIGTNTSSINITILDPDEEPFFFAQADIKSSSDANFYYRPSKYAREVKYLTLKGFERIFKEALPQAFS
ncbi:MAG: hypothetical protein LBP51_01185 [Deferribacteraceae bacterium]|jgi:hypothetical protein|nr:hypothetical protein [Deferribacteraceae bacterium]